MTPSGAKFPTCWKMHRRASHAIFIHRRGFSTFRHECIASQRVAGPIGATRFEATAVTVRRHGDAWSRGQTLGALLIQGRHHVHSHSTVCLVAYDFTTLDYSIGTIHSTIMGQCTLTMNMAIIIYLRGSFQLLTQIFAYCGRKYCIGK